MGIITSNTVTDINFSVKDMLKLQGFFHQQYKSLFNLTVEFEPQQLLIRFDVVDRPREDNWTHSNEMYHVLKIFPYETVRIILLGLEAQEILDHSRG